MAQFFESKDNLNAHKMSAEQLRRYNDNMERGMVDKLFFLSRVPKFDLLVDYGCANGALIKATKQFEPDAEYWGFDISDDMLETAQQNISGNNIHFTSDWSTIQQRVEQCNGISICTCNSLIHEIKSYCDDKDYFLFFKRLFNSGFDFISIRDMMMKQTDYNKKLDSEELDDIKVALSQYDNGIEKIESFENIWGEIEKEGELIHLLMKWNYWKNWDREVHEDYLGVFTDNFFRQLNGTAGRGNYSVKEWYPFTLEFLKDYSREITNGWEIKSPTHIKMLLELKGEHRQA